jgi:thioredoxin-related protein
MRNASLLRKTKRMTRLTATIAALALTATTLTAGHVFSAERADEKITALYFYKPGCPYCREFERGPLKDPAVIKEISTLEWVKVKTTGDISIDYRGAKVSQRELAVRYGVNLTPTVTFVGADGKTLANIRGFFETPDFLEMLKYVTEGHYKTETFDAYIARKARGD